LQLWRARLIPMTSYQQTINRLIASVPFTIDTSVQMRGHPPTLASSDFLTNREQGDWAEKVVVSAINENFKEYRAIPYGHSGRLAAGDLGFSEFYGAHQDELNSIGKKPDVLIFHRSQIEGGADLGDNGIVKQAVAAIEVRSSSFLTEKYTSFIRKRLRQAEKECVKLQNQILQEPLVSLLSEKAPELHTSISQATSETFKELNFRARSWSSSDDLLLLSELLKKLKAQIKILHRRDYLSFTPKLEDLALINRWIQHFGVHHYYLQVFFDKAYVISFKDILTICSDPSQEGAIFSVEQDIKNQGKTTFKINVNAGHEMLQKIDIPSHKSALRELDRGRLLFYVTFEGGQAHLDKEIFLRHVVNGT